MTPKNRLDKILKKTGEDVVDMSSLKGLKSPFEILVTIGLGLRVRDEQVIPVRDSLFGRDPLLRPKKIRFEDEMLVYNFVRPLGMGNARMKMIHSVINYFEEHGAPTTFGQVMEIDGIGPKAAALYLDVAFSRQSVCIDTHCKRVLNRIGYPGDPKTLQLDLMTDLDKSVWSSVNGKLISHGKTLCKPKPDCGRCFLDCTVS